MFYTNKIRLLINVKEFYMECIDPFYKKNNIPIVLACDNNYVPFTAVLLTSLEKNSSKDYNYDILLFEKDITDFNKQVLRNCLKGRKNISLRFIDFASIAKNFSLRVCSYYSIEIYFRLFAPWVLDKYDKVLYFDCDLVFNADVSKLYNINIKNKFLAAVRDVGMLLHKRNPKSGISKDYYTDYLTGVNIDNYFNSGVLIMNIKKFREELELKDIIKLIQSKNWHFPDQDVLNVICGKKTYILPSSWNSIPENSGDRKIQTLIEYLPQKYIDYYVNGKSNPYIIHYAMREKPWKYSINLDFEMGKYFWQYAFQSPLINQILKIKSRTCCFAELRKLIELFDDFSFVEKETKNDIEYYYKDTLISKYSSKIIKFETADFNENYFMIDGWFSVGNSEKQVDAVYFECDGFGCKCKVVDKNDNDYFGDEIIGKKYVFKAKVPIDKIKGKKEFRIRFKVGQKNIFAKAYNYGRFFPVDRIFDKQYFSKNDFMLQATSKAVILKPCLPRESKKQEKLFMKQLKKNKNNNKEIKSAIKIRKIYNFLKPFCRKQIWLVSDNFLADDNGMAFFEYLYKNKPKKIKYFFAVFANNERYKELKKKYKRKLLVYGTKKFKVYSLLADLKLSSIVDMYFNRPFRNLEHFGRDIYARQKFIFLQHGVISNDMSREHNKYVYNPAGFVTTGIPEQKELQTDKYFYEKENIILTGLSRFDKLYNDDKKYITIMPTWRKYLIFKNGRKNDISDEEFKASNYFKFYNCLLNNEKLYQTACKYGYQLCLMQHPLFIRYDNCFDIKNSKFKILNEKHRDAFAHSSLILSDYSSTIFDFLYLKKPIVYTHFDSEEFYSGGHAYDKGFIDHENDGFGECELSLESTVDRLCEYMENGCKIKDVYKNKVEEFFAYIDKENSLRIFNECKKIANQNQYKNIFYYLKRFNEVKKQKGLKTAFDMSSKIIVKRLRRK